MDRTFRIASLITLLWAAFVSGCRSPESREPKSTLPLPSFGPSKIEQPLTEIEPNENVLATLPPRTGRHVGPVDDWKLSLEEVVRLALANSRVIRDIDGRIVSSPGTASTVFDRSLAETDPSTGPEAALSDFDAQLSTTAFLGRNERAINNTFLDSAVGGVRSNDAAVLVDLRKTAATGSQFALRHFTQYDREDAPGDFVKSWDSFVEAEVRQPLLRGAGLEFNRIAGPRATPGNYRGVLLGRLNTEISLADFEFAVRNLLVEVERTYWELYFAYRELDAKQMQRDAALATWQLVQQQTARGLASPEREALARESYFEALADVENARSGRQIMTHNRTLTGTPTNALLGGTTAGVFALERRLRYLLELPANDGRLIRPADEPAAVDILFDWHDSLLQALWRRVELRKQKWTIQRRELELVAARNFLHPQLDVVGQYRVRGYGDELANNVSTANDRQEWQVGVQASVPFGKRLGHTAVRNAELGLARERAVYREQESQVAHELDSAFAALDRAFIVTRTNFNRRVAAHQRVETLLAEFRQFGEDAQHGVRLEHLLDAQRRTAASDAEYFRSLVDYNLAVANVHFARGTSLEYLGVYLTEGPSSLEAQISAARTAERFRWHRGPRHLDKPQPLSAGEYPQRPATVAATLPGPTPEYYAPPRPETPPPPPPGFGMSPPPNRREAIAGQRSFAELGRPSQPVPPAAPAQPQVVASQPPVRRPPTLAVPSLPVEPRPAARPAQANALRDEPPPVAIQWKEPEPVEAAENWLPLETLPDPSARDRGSISPDIPPSTVQIAPSIPLTPRAPSTASEAAPKPKAETSEVEWQPSNVPIEPETIEAKRRPHRPLPTATRPAPEPQTPLDWNRKRRG